MANAVLVTLTVGETLRIADACPDLRGYLISRVRDTVGHTHGCRLGGMLSGIYTLGYYYVVSNGMTKNNFVANWGCTSAQMQHIPIYDSLVETMGCLDSGLL